MRDPHIQKMFFQVNSGEAISYDNPEPITFNNYLGDFEIRDGKLQITPAEHFSDEEGARQAIEPFLRSWEIEADLNSNVGMIRFKFERVEVIDRNPPPPGSPQIIHLKGITSGVTLIGNVSLRLICKKYPDPPNSFHATPEVQYAYRRWVAYRQGKEPLQSMAYFVLTILESAAGNRKTASSTFRIEPRILHEIGRLASTRGDETTARKATKDIQFQELTGSEKRWLEAAIRKIIHRLGEHASGTLLTQISLSDLPDL